MVLAIVKALRASAGSRIPDRGDGSLRHVVHFWISAVPLHWHPKPRHLLQSLGLSENQGPFSKQSDGGGCGQDYATHGVNSLLADPTYPLDDPINRARSTRQQHQEWWQIANWIQENKGYCQGIPA